MSIAKHASKFQNLVNQLNSIKETLSSKDGETLVTHSGYQHYSPLVTRHACMLQATSHSNFFTTYKVGDFSTVKMENISFLKIERVGDVQIKTNTVCTMVFKDA